MSLRPMRSTRVCQAPAASCSHRRIETSSAVDASSGEVRRSARKAGSSRSSRAPTVKVTPATRTNEMATVINMLMGLDLDLRQTPDDHGADRLEHEPGGNERQAHG